MKIGLMQIKYKSLILFLAILSIGIGFRSYSINWDSGQHLHPDERFLTMVNNDTKLPMSFKEYFNRKVSNLNPRNVGHKLYVYGNFPLIINKILAVRLDHDNYGEIVLQGRFLSVLVDVFTGIYVFFTVKLLEKKYHFFKKSKFWAMLFYYLAVLPIQLSHFFTTDTFMSFFAFASFYHALHFYYHDRKWWHVGFSAIFFAFALGSKIMSLLIFPLVGSMIFFSFLQKKEKIDYFVNLFGHFKIKNIKLGVYALIRQILTLILFVIVSYLVLRIVDPYLFDTPSVTNPKINPNIMDNLSELFTLNENQDEIWFPPAVQWISKPRFVYGFANMVVFGVGVPYFIVSILGLVYLIQVIKSKNFFKHVSLIFIFLWSIAYILYQTSRFNPTMRYFIMVYPFLAIYAAIGLTQVILKLFKNKIIVRGFIFILFMIWPLMFFNVYVQDHTRVRASEWIYQHVADDAYILNEAWDDGLPLLLPEYGGKIFKGTQVPVYNPDNFQKWEEIREMLSKADYYIISSKRAWASTSYAKKQYPLMDDYYRKLMSGQLGFKKVAEFTNYPSLSYLGIPLTFNDDNAEEAFTVYDHPKVMIFEKVE